MDPQACLQRALDADKEGELTEAFEALNDLWYWVASKGFRPYMPVGANVCVETNNYIKNGKISYTLITEDGGTAKLTKYSNGRVVSAFRLPAEVKN